MRAILKSLMTAAAVGMSVAPALAADPPTDASQAIPALMEALSRYRNGEAATEKNLKTFDTLDFDV